VSDIASVRVSSLPGTDVRPGVVRSFKRSRWRKRTGPRGRLCCWA